MKKEKELCASFAVALHTAKVMATMGAKCLVKVEKALNLWVEDTSRKDALIDSNVLHRTALNLHGDFTRGPLEGVTPCGNTDPRTGLPLSSHSVIIVIMVRRVSTAP